MKTKVVILIVGVVSFLLGATAMSLWWWYAYTHWLVFPKEVELASRAGMHAVALAHLRLNESTNAIHQLEMEMDQAVAMIAQWEQSGTAKEEIRKARDKWLTPVKMYRESYPSQGDDAVLVHAFLAQVPGRNLQKVCDSSVCRLDDLHRAALNTSTNLVTEAESGKGE